MDIYQKIIFTADWHELDMKRKSYHNNYLFGQASGVVTMEDFAELSIGEVVEIDDTLEESKAAELILKAREPWFAGEAENS